jgi:serine/threonine protein kinase
MEQLVKTKDLTKKLVVVAGPDAGRTIILDDGATTWTVGRGVDVDARMKDPYVSRVHFTLEIGVKGVIIADAGSRAGTLVGGVKISKRQLWHGDEIEIGSSSLRYESDPSGEVARWRSQSRIDGAMSLINEGMDDLVGQTIGHFKLKRIAHLGGVSVLFRGQDQQHDRPVMVKVMYPSITSDDAHRNRFVRAVHSMMNVRHPNLVEIYGAGKQGPYCWCAMEFVDGPSLLDIISSVSTDGRMDWREAYRVAVHVARALEYAHDQKVIHRNVTPNNLIQRADDGVVKLCDLMLAKALEGANAEQFTASGEMIGEAAYASPEQMVNPSTVDWRSDQYGLGATLYALLTGRPPYEATSLEELHAFQQGVRTFPPEVQREANAEFLPIVLKMLAKSPEDRFALPSQLLDHLDELGEQFNVDVEYKN